MQSSTEMWGRSLYSNHPFPAEIKAHTRAMIAYFAGEMILHRGFREVYDPSTDCHLHLTARLDEDSVDVADLEAGIHLAGDAFGRHFCLTHQQENYSLELNLAGKNFDGEVSKSGRTFKGYVEDNRVTFIEGDHEYVFSLS